MTAWASMTSRASLRWLACNLTLDPKMSKLSSSPSCHGHAQGRHPAHVGRLLHATHTGKGIDDDIEGISWVVGAALLQPAAVLSCTAAHVQQAVRSHHET